MAKKPTYDKVDEVNDYQFARLRTEMFFGSREVVEETIIGFDGEKLVPQKMKFVPAIATYFREIVDNALDEIVGHGHGNKIDVTFDPTTMTFSVEDNGRGVPSEVVNALKAEAGRTGKGDAAPCVAESDGLRWIVRRLTPLEGERCQGWPDDWSRWRADGSEISDSARWRMIGNGVATPVAYWIATRLRAALAAGQGQEQGGAG